MRVLSVASEIYPLVKTGGLADVAGALPAALRPLGVNMQTLVPGYPAVLKHLSGAKQLRTYVDLFGGQAQVLEMETHGLDLLVLDAPHLFNRPGNPYLGPDGKDWPDSAQRFAAFAQVAADLARFLKFDLLHLHDWQAALAAVHTRFLGGPKSVLTIHNIAFQGVFPVSIFGQLGLPPQAFALDGLEYYGNVSYLKGGIASASLVTTVSPTYAEEICTPEFGMGLDGIIRTRRTALHGIVNGIDTEVWNPATDKALPSRFTAEKLSARKANKRALEKQMGLSEGEGILHGVVSRLTWQKGLDLLAAELDGLVNAGARLALVGTGEAALEQAVVEAAKRHPGRIAVSLKYDEALSHLVQGGADTILVPSRFEPCGLTQLYGLRYGCVPVVARTGGLADTVIDANDAALSTGVATGLHLPSVNQAGLQAGLARAARLHANQVSWASLQRAGMAQDVSWTRSAAQYVKLYRTIAA